MKRTRKMMHHLLLVLVGLAWSFTANAYDFKAENEDGVTIYYDVDEGQATVVSGESLYVGDIRIPSEVSYSGNTLPVTAIGHSAFMNCPMLTSVVMPNTITDVGAQAFLGCGLLKSVTLSQSLTSISQRCFWNCPSLASVVIPYGVTSIAIDAFNRCSGLTSVELPNSLRLIEGNAFSGCKALKSLSLPGSLESIGTGAFYGCNSLTVVESHVKTPFPIDTSVFSVLGKHQVLKVPSGTRDLYLKTAGWTNYFENVEEQTMESLPYALWCEDNATLYFLSSSEAMSAGQEHDGHTISAVWSGNDVTMTERNIPQWNTIANKASAVKIEESFKTVTPTSLYAWFYSFTKLTGIEGLENLNTSKTVDMQAMFINCTDIEKLDLSGFDTQNVRTMKSMFYGCSSLVELNIGNFNTSKVTNMYAMFKGCTKLKALDLSRFETGNVEDLGSMFYECHSLTSLDLSNFDTRSVKNMEWMFFDCRSLAGLNLLNFQTSNVESMRAMFGYCRKMKNVKISHWDTSKVTSMRSMFINCDSLRTVDLGSLNTERVTTMQMMFRDCKRLVSVNLSSFNTKNVENMDSMFYGCLKLRRVYVGDDWTTEKVNTAADMFASCTNIEGECGTRFEQSHIGADYARIDTESHPGYFVSAGLADETIMVNLTLDCTGGGTMVYEGAEVKNAKETIKVPLGSTVTVELIPDDGCNVVKKSVSAGHAPVSIGIGSRQLVVYDILEDAVMKAEFSQPSAITSTSVERMTDSAWYSLQGQRIDGTPTQSGVYIHNGRKTYIK